MWKAAAGHQVQSKNGAQQDDDDWETEADFEVYILLSNFANIFIFLLCGCMRFSVGNWVVNLRCFQIYNFHYAQTFVVMASLCGVCVRVNIFSSKSTRPRYLIYRG